MLDGAKILRETWKIDEVVNSIVPLYDNEDSVCGIEYNGTAYYFLKNLQGDVIAITDSSGEEVARYSYDAWGALLSVKDADDTDITDKSHIANINPFRYRSYYFDLESGLYYLQSRYYDAQVGRFVNGDMVEIAVMQQDVLEHNLFAYCGNEPVGLIDSSGLFGTPIQWACAAIGGVLGILFGDSIARWMGLSPSGKGRLSATKYWAVRAAVIVGGAALGYLVGTGIIKLVGMFAKSHPKLTITLVKKLGINVTSKIMNIFGLNFMKNMTSGALINFVTNWFTSPGTKMPLAFVKLLVEACQKLGIEIVFHAGHYGTAWNIPHLHLGNHKGHLALAANAVAWIKKFLGV